MRLFGALCVSVVVGVLVGVVVLPSVASADGVRDGQWYLDGFDIDAVHDLSQGAGVRIGLIDSGVDATHPDLEGNVEPGAEFDENGRIDGDGLTDTRSHGTSVAAVLAGHGHGPDNSEGVMGIAPKATIIPATAHIEQGEIGKGSGSVGKALEWLVEQDVDIISISMSTGNDPQTDSIINEAVDKGIAIVAAAGNRVADTDWGTIETPHASYPARAAGVTPVAGTTQDGSYWKDSSDLQGASAQPQLGLSAPSVDIPIAQPGGAYDVSDGTSLATPIVAGTYALVMAAYPDLDFFVQEDRILDTVDDKGDKGFDDHYGWGIVNPLGSLTEETSYSGPDGTVVSSPDDILPLEEQGKGDSESSGDGPSDPATSDEAGALTPVSTDTIPGWLIIAAAVVVVAVAVLVTVVLLRRRRTKSTVPPVVPHPIQPGAQHYPTPRQ